MNDRPTLPVVGRLVLENGVLVARRDDTGQPCGYVYVGPDGIELEGELSLVQVDDPAKLRFKLVRQNESRGYIGGFSANIARDDGRGEEVAYNLFSLAEDAETGSLRSQFSVHLKRVTQEQPTPALVLTSAYSPELFGENVRRIYGLGVRWLSHLWKFETVEDRRTNEDEPASPQPPSGDDWLTPQSVARHAAECLRIEQETGIPMDDDRKAAYMDGRNRDLAEVHDDELGRTPFEQDPCDGANRIPLG